MIGNMHSNLIYIGCRPEIKSGDWFVPWDGYGRTRVTSAQGLLMVLNRSYPVSVVWGTRWSIQYSRWGRFVWWFITLKSKLQRGR